MFETKLGPSVAVIDGDIIVYKAAALSTDGDIFEACDMVDTLIDRWTENCGCHSHVLALTPRGIPTFRHTLYPPYKAQRPIEKPNKFEAIRDHIHTFAHVEVEGLEADDVMGVLSTRDGTVTVTIDKDLMQVPGRLYNPDKDEHYNITPEQASYHYHLQWIMGDSTDNYLGVKGLGPVKANKLLESTAPDQWTTAVLRTYHERKYDYQYCLTMAKLARIVQHKEEPIGSVLWQAMKDDQDLIKWATPPAGANGPCSS